MTDIGEATARLATAGVRQDRRARLGIALAAIAFAALVGATAWQAMETSYATHPIWVEQVAYLQFPSVQYLGSIETSGRWTTVWSAIRGGERHLLQPLLLGLLAPPLLGWTHAHLLISLPAFAIFLGLFGWTVYRRVGCLSYAVGATSLYLALSGLPNERWGLGTGFADQQASWLLGSGVLCLLNALTTDRAAWVRAGAIFIALSALARTTAAFHAVVMAGPILLLYLITEGRATRSWQKPAATLASVAAITAPAAAIVLWQMRRLLWYYTSANAWNLKQPLTTSAATIGSLTAQFIGLLAIVAAALVLAGWIAVAVAGGLRGEAAARSAVGTPELAVWWSGAGFLLYLLAMGYTSDVPKEVLYAVPGLLLGCVAPFRLLGTSATRRSVAMSPPAAPDSQVMSVSSALAATREPASPERTPSRPSLLWLRAAGAALLIFSLTGFALNARATITRAGLVEPYMIEWRASQVEMASALAKFPARTVWQSYTWPDWGIPVSLFTYWNYGKVQRGGDLFVNRKVYWESRNPGLSQQEVEERLYARTLELVDVALILKDPAHVPQGMEPYSHALASAIASRVRSDPRWQYDGEVSGAPFSGPLAIYVKADGRAGQVRNGSRSSGGE